ncbi:MAG: LacI family DNA-binding transcriptional regulator [Candidatus Promineifilaceae bacterium]|nr:LacI family DNA-binding transcriptional regulator [Candidatus Promineifilaceae bacterium]
MSVTIKDISKRLGISVSTVSKALNDYPDVSEDTRKRILDMARELDYHPNLSAQNLRRRRTSKIGLLITYPVSFIGEYLSQIVNGAAQVAEIEGYNIVLYTTIANQLDQITRICRSREVDGLLVLWARQLEDTLTLIEREAMPFVAVARRVADHRISYVVCDNQQGALQLTRHLIEQGHQRIGFMPYPELRETNLDRMAGYRLALEEAGIPYDETLLLPVTPEAESRRKALHTLMDLPDPPTAIFAFHDYIAIEAMQAALDRGLRVPQDVAIAGFDGMHSTMITTPPLTTVKQPTQEIGRRAVEVLLNQISDIDQPPEQITLPVELITRQSTIGAN